MGTTDYTRFGAWRIQWAQNPLRGNNWFHRELESFAYSPLPVAMAQWRDKLPLGGRATYTGETVAYLGLMTDALHAKRGDFTYMGSQAACEGATSFELRWYRAHERESPPPNLMQPPRRPSWVDVSRRC